jgi:hypothetical protein
MSRRAKAAQLIDQGRSDAREIAQGTFRAGMTLARHVLRYVSYQIAVRR